MPFNLIISSLYITYFIILVLLDNDVLETSKRRAMFYNILSQIFIVKCNANHQRLVAWNPTQVRIADLFLLYSWKVDPR